MQKFGGGRDEKICAAKIAELLWTAAALCQLLEDERNCGDGKFGYLLEGAINELKAAIKTAGGPVSVARSKRYRAKLDEAERRQNEEVSRYKAKEAAEHK